MAKLATLLVVLAALTGCGETWGQRAVTGGGVGAASGAVIGSVTHIGLLPGAVVGSAIGAGIGAATAPPH
jgi:hypothetical protein